MPKKNIDLICVGQLKSKIFSDLEKQILKKIRPQYKVNIIEIKDEKNINIFFKHYLHTKSTAI